MPRRASARAKADVGAADGGLIVRVSDGVDENFTGEPVGWSSSGLSAASCDLHVLPPSMSMVLGEPSGVWDATVAHHVPGGRSAWLTSCHGSELHRWGVSLQPDPRRGVVRHR